VFLSLPHKGGQAPPFSQNRIHSDYWGQAASQVMSGPRRPALLCCSIGKNKTNPYVSA